MELRPVDIHSHLLPGVDDGFRNAEDSLRAIGIMAEHGCREFVFTPHMNPDVYPDGTEEHLKQVYEDFVPRIPKEWGVSTSLAAEYMVVSGFEERASRPEELLTFPDGSILVEMSYYFRSENIEKALFALNLAGLRPILAHPERYLYMSDCLEDFKRFKEIGCRFQMNFASVTGKYGPASIKIMKYLLGRGMYDFVATDLHSIHQLESILGATPVWKVRWPVRRFLKGL